MGKSFVGRKKHCFFWATFILISSLTFMQCASTTTKENPEPNTENQNENQNTIAETVDEKIPEVPKGPSEEEIKLAKQENTIQTIIEGMSLEQKIAQMIMPSIYKRPNSYEAAVTKIKPYISDAIKKYNFGGIILFKANTNTSAQTLTLVHELQSAATAENSGNKIPLFIGIDQEGGTIIRLNNSCWMPGNMLVGASGDPGLSERYANLVGSEIAAVGANVNFAPVADVNCNPENPVIGLRSFSSDPNLVAKMVGGSIKGYSDENIVSALKHFPGHGDTSVDSHAGLPRIDKSLDQLKKMELVPFASGIKNGADMIMTAHIQFPNIETQTYRSISTGQQIYLPATLSKKIITDILRGELGFDGIVITDAMDMGAVTQHFRKLDAAKLAINAGVDILLMSCDLSTEADVRNAGQLISSLASAVKNGEISEDRINESVKRILRVKYKYGILDWKPDLQNRLEHATGFISSIENHNKEWDISAQGMTIVKNENGLLPLSPEKKVAILYPFSTETTSIKYGIDYVERKFQRKLDVTLLSYTGKSYGALSSTLSKMDAVVIVTELSKPAQFNQFYDSSSRFAFPLRAIENLHRLGKKVIIISAELPYDIAAYKDADAIIAAYGAYEMTKAPTTEADRNPGYGPNLPVSVATTFGAASPKGKLPVDIYALNKNFKYTNEIVFPIGTGSEY